MLLEKIKYSDLVVKFTTRNVHPTDTGFKAVLVEGQCVPRDIGNKVAMSNIKKIIRNSQILVVLVFGSNCLL